MTPSVTTMDAFLDGRLQIVQPRDGYRAATDPVFLAAAVPAKPGQTVLDVGCGVGVAALCLAQRVQGAVVSGLEIQPDYADLAVRNAQENNLPLEVFSGDLRDLPDKLRQLQFDHVMTNPPFYPHTDATAPASAGKTVAHLETADLTDWITLCMKRLKPKGSFSIIHRADRLPQILGTLQSSAGDIRILPLAPRRGRPAKRVIVRARKGSRAELRLLAPLDVHRGTHHEHDGDDYSELARAVLRSGQALTM